MADPRTFKVPMSGDDVGFWQGELKQRYAAWHVDYPLTVDRSYGPATRAATASFMRAWGVADTGEALSRGLTPEWRSKLRNDDRTDEEEYRFVSSEIIDYRRALRNRFHDIDVCYPVPNISDDAWGWHGTAHDGVDLICPNKQPVLAICRARVVRAENGWSNLYAPLGDGIVILESLIDDGPFFKGLCFGYGHAEGFQVSKGDTVEAGQLVAHAGMANAWHIHFMVNGGGFPKAIGHGDRDPAQFLKYAREAS